MNEKHSLLNNIRSKYILQNILTYAFGNFNSVLKFLAYDKVLLNRLHINNIKDYYDYKTKTLVKKKFSVSMFHLILFENFFNIPLIIYNIRFLKNGKFFFVFWLMKNYQFKLDFIYFVDKYITNIFLFIELIYYLFFIIYYKRTKMIITDKTKFIIKIINSVLCLAYYVIHCIKYSYTHALTKNLLPNYGNKDLEWFYTFDKALVCLLPFVLFFIFLSSLSALTYIIRGSDEDEKWIILNQINGYDIVYFYLPLEFEDLNKKDKLGIIFKKENMKQYKCKLDDTQRILIGNINRIRRQNKIPGFFSYNNYLPDYIINKKTELIFYKDKNIYKFSNNYYLIKYPTSKYQKDINDNNIINIIKNNFLDQINIIRKGDYEYIALYNNQFNENENNIRRRNNINNVNINLKSRIKKPSTNISNLEERLIEYEQSMNLSLTRVYDNDNDRNENI